MSGARMHHNYFRPGGVHQDVPLKLLTDIADWLDTRLPRLFDDAISLVADNRIFKQRNVDIATVSRDDAIAWGFSGPMIRAAGLPWDLRKSQPYDVYATDGLRRAGGDARRLLRSLHGARRGGAAVGADHEAVPGRDARGAGAEPRPQGDAAQARRHEAVDGGADPSLQAVTPKASTSPPARSMSRPRAPRASLACIWSRTGPTSRIAARSGRRRSRTCRRWTS